jgi:hypothetical protein
MLRAGAGGEFTMTSSVRISNESDVDFIHLSLRHCLVIDVNIFFFLLYFFKTLRNQLSSCRTRSLTLRQQEPFFCLFLLLGASSLRNNHRIIWSWTRKLMVYLFTFWKNDFNSCEYVYKSDNQHDFECTQRRIFNHPPPSLLICQVHTSSSD